jgi:hypothetical protein
MTPEVLGQALETQLDLHSLIESTATMVNTEQVVSTLPMDNMLKKRNNSKICSEKTFNNSLTKAVLMLHWKVFLRFQKTKEAGQRI